MAREVMYIGKKPTKKDNVNDEPNRIWRGLGDVQTVTDIEARRLVEPRFKEVWLDVTGMEEAVRSSIIAKLREQFREEQLRVTPAEDVSRVLSAASDQQLLGELQRRQLTDGLPSRNALPPAGLRSTKLKDSPLDEDVRERPTNTEELIEELAGTIASLDKENPEHFSDGYPVTEAIEDVLGYRVSKSEIEAALNLLKGN